MERGTNIFIVYYFDINMKKPKKIIARVRPGRPKKVVRVGYIKKFIKKK